MDCYNNKYATTYHTVITVLVTENILIYTKNDAAIRCYLFRGKIFRQ